VAEVGEEAALVDREACEGAVTMEFRVGALPKEFAGIRRRTPLPMGSGHFGDLRRLWQEG
jgi:hypothetical protein